MKVSELTLNTIKQYLRIDGNDDDVLLQMLLDASVQYCTSYMGCNKQELEKYEDVTVVILSLISDSYEVRQFTTSIITLNPFMQGVLDLHCGNLLGVEDVQTNNTPTSNEVKVYNIIWGIATQGAPSKTSRGYLEYSQSSGFGKLHLDMNIPNTASNGVAICTLPNDAPTPISLLEVAVTPSGSIYVEPNTRDVKCWGVATPKRYIIDLVGFWKGIQ
jgi:uncharacterized phage protein (predicted DNA packaging)